jgi:hypothetical protein
MDDLRIGFVFHAAGRPRDVVRPALWLAVLLALPCGGQDAAMPNGGQAPMHTLHASQDMDEGSQSNPIVEERRLRQLNAAQHKAMVADTDRLLKLVNELNAEISRTNPSSLSGEQRRKVAEIEKLARGVKDKMRISVRGTPNLPDVISLPPIDSH